MTLGFSGRPTIVEGPIHLDWIEHGSCVGSDVSVFFPKRGQTGLEAKRICAGCPVRGECLDYALDRGELYGVWGGLNREERMLVRRERRSA